jgi:synapsin
MFSFFSSSGGAENSATSVSSPPSTPKVTLVVIVPNQKSDFQKLFENSILSDGRLVEVVEVTWAQFVVAAYPEQRGCYLHLTNGRTIHPDFLLIRSEVRGVSIEQDFRNSLFGLMFANVPSVNSLHSIYCFLERPVVQAELNRLNRTLGDEIFPVVDQSYFSSYRGMMYGNSFPAVVKVGHAHAGYGKMKINHHHDMDDFKTVLALSNHYVTAEPFLEGSYDLRIQKIGSSHYRAFRRISMSGAWKTNTGSSHLEEIEVTPMFRRWADEASQLFGGLDICTVDAIHDSKTDRDVIMEVNGTSSGLSPEVSDEDHQHIKQLVLEKMNALLCLAPGTVL